MTTDRSTPYTLDQVGTGAVRFPSGIAIPTASDLAVDPYALSRISKHVHVEGVMFWPQVREKFPAVVLLHEWWGLNSQAKDTAARMACEGYVVLVPNLYGRQGGMVTASSELAGTLMERLITKDVLQDINSCCEYLNTRDHVIHNAHAVVGFGLGGTLALQFGAYRRRLKAVVSYYGRVPAPGDYLKDLHCPALYHQAGDDDWVSPEDVARLRGAAEQHGKVIDVRTYDGAPHAFMNETRKDSYRPDTAASSWDATCTFLTDCFKGARTPS